MFKASLLIGLALLSFSARADEVKKRLPPRNAIYADLGFFNEALENGGMGLGVGLEHSFADHLGFRVRHGIIQRDLGTQVISHTVTIFSFSYYPMSVGLEGFNVALGMGYSNTQIVRDPTPFYQKIFPFVDIYVGYKMVFWDVLLIEPYLNWLAVTKNTDLSNTGIHQIVDIFGLTLGVAF